ncbi:hypothetical protein [Klebsiella pneumoniae]|uniref:hypothetical protein n=1 Tax=Klebsiella pneumoniae TaxID=573 RepID=UPI0021D26734|nr:hypothetical protein [Klebsiella pneumoniae]
MKNEVEQIALQNDMSIEFVTWFFNEKKVGCGNVWLMMMAAMWEGWKGRSIEMDKLAAENVALALENVAMKQIVDSLTNLDNEPQYHAEGMGCGLEDRGITDRYDACRYGWDEAMERIYGDVIPCAEELDFSATDRIVAGIKADGVAKREKTITFTAAKKRTQDGVALIAIGKTYKIHNDDVIGEFFIGERGRYGVITMDRLNYFATSDEYAWAFSLREGADR